MDERLVQKLADEGYDLLHRAGFKVDRKKIAVYLCEHFQECNETFAWVYLTMNENGDPFLHVTNEPRKKLRHRR